MICLAQVEILAASSRQTCSEFSPNKRPAHRDEPADNPYTEDQKRRVWTRCATSEGLAKIPAPTMPPMTIIVASNNPSSRRGFGASNVNLSSRCRIQSVDSELRSGLYQRRRLIQMPCKIRIVLEPPKRVGCENKIRRAMAP